MKQINIGPIRKRRKGNTYSCYIWYMDEVMNVKRQIFLHTDSILEMQDKITEITSQVQNGEI